MNDNRIKAVIVFAVILAFLCLVFTLANPVGASSKIGGLVPHPNVSIRVGGGDCSANLASNDLQKPLDDYCETNLRFIYVTVACSLAAADPVEIVQEETLTREQKQQANKIRREGRDENSPEPSQEIVQNTPPENQNNDTGGDGEENPPEDKPKKDKPDKDKDNKPNSGNGNGSEDCDGDGQDDDPGNSGGHNNGKD